MNDQTAQAGSPVPAAVAPTLKVGQPMHFFRPHHGDQAEAAIIAYVHNDNCVNLAVFDPQGKHTGQTSVYVRLDKNAPLPSWAESWAELPA